MSAHTEVHKELTFEKEICAHLVDHTWSYSEGDKAAYDRPHALFPADLSAWVQATQPDAWVTLTANHGADAEATLLKRVRAALDQRGTLDVLRHGVELVGLKRPIQLAQFRPAMGLNAETVGRYDANRLRVIRQVRYSEHNENALDLVLFLNGIPVATAELKTDFTQSIEDATWQYRHDRLPKTNQGTEPLLAFPGGALVHFAVSNAEVHMTTRLDGPKTRFLPFNRGDHGGKGNPVNVSGGHRTAYLWEQVWQRDSWLEILGRYVVTTRDEAKRPTGVIFPRYHQLDATRALVAAVRAEGAGGKYLIQHSAGSGKTNSIAWTAHFFSELWKDDQKVFDAVLVVSDRRVIDAQLQDAIFGFQRTTGVVYTITGKEGSKSADLAKALADGKQIIVCTIQTFPFALAAVQELSAAQRKRFAVIADEAHSSQAGEAAAKLKAVLSPAEIAELEEGGEVSTEDLLAAQMAARAKPDGITYVAFTATPKAKTLELFGRRPDPGKPAGSNNLPEPFHVYSMRQAIEEGFILDILRNYTSYKLAFKLATGGGELTDVEVERAAAMKGIMGWVRLHPYNIAQKVQVVVEHFRELVQPLLGGHAKAMVVVASRVEAVRWQRAIEKYIAENGYSIRTLVAFSGEVRDLQTGPDPFSETSPFLNPGLKGRDIRDAFATDEYQILLVANKYQTGFDQPLLSAMYVDRRLAGIQAVQTLSRLNRAYEKDGVKKETTYVVDFVNDPAEILKAFKAYYTTAELTGVTDPNVILDLKGKLDAQGFYDEPEVDRVAKVELSENPTQGALLAALAPVEDRLMKRWRAAQEAEKAAAAVKNVGAQEAAKAELDSLTLFKADMGSYVRLYAFLSQIFDYGNTAVEKRAVFYRRLLPLLDFGRQREGIDTSKLALTHHTLKNKGAQPMTLPGGKYPGLDPVKESGRGGVQVKEKAWLSEIVAKLNDLFEGELTDGDKLVYVNNALKGKLLESDTLREQANNNTKEQFANSPDLKSELLSAIIAAFDAHSTMSSQALASERVREGLKDVLLNYAGLYESLRQQREAGPTP